VLRTRSAGWRAGWRVTVAGLAVSLAVAACGGSAPPTVRSLLAPVIRALTAGRPCEISGRFPVGLDGLNGASAIRARSIGSRTAGTVTSYLHGVGRADSFVAVPTAEFVQFDSRNDPFRPAAHRPWIALDLPGSRTVLRLINSGSTLGLEIAGLVSEVQADANVGGCLRLLQSVDRERGAPVQVSDGGRVQRIGPLPDTVLGASTDGQQFVLTLIGGRPAKLSSGGDELTFTTPAHVVVSAPLAATVIPDGQLRLTAKAAAAG
jgi:hypothetical protein